LHKRKREAKAEVKDIRIQRLLGNGMASPRRERTVDEVKDRYYSVARALKVHLGHNDHVIVTKPFDAEAEIRRKSDLEKYYMRTK